MVLPLQGYEQQPLVSLKEAIQPLVSIVPGITQMFDTVQENLNQLTDHLSVDESASIMLYRLKWKSPESSFQFILNETLRSQIREQLLPWFLYLRLFIHALSKLPFTPIHTVYYELRVDINDEYSKGNMFIWWNFVSCKSSIEYFTDSINDNQEKAIFIIDCDSAKDISRYSLDRNDNNEIILYPGRQFQVISLLSYGNQNKFIQLKEILYNTPLIHIPQITSSRVYSPRHLETIIDQYPRHSKIDLIELGLSDANMSVVVNHAIINKQCQQLLLSKNKITSIGSSIIAAALNNNMTLKLLSLSYNHLSDEGVESLAKILELNNSKLETLSIHGTGITDKCIRCLTNMLKKNTTLTWLHLGGNKISDQLIHRLTDVLIHDNKTLKALDLSNNALITDSSVNSLIEMIESTESLETLWINNCQISSEAKKRLQKIVDPNRRFFLLFT